MNSSASSSTGISVSPPIMESKPLRMIPKGKEPVPTTLTHASGESMAATATNSSIKFLRDLLARILNGESASDILTGLDPMNKGHTGEALLRLLTLFGIHPTDPSAIVVPYRFIVGGRRLEAISSFQDRLNEVNSSIISGKKTGSIDVCWSHNNLYAVCSSKAGMIKVTAIGDLEIIDMLSQFTESGGLTDGGKAISRESAIAYALVGDKEQVLDVARRSTMSSCTTTDNVKEYLDFSDLDRMCCIFRERFVGCKSKDPTSLLSHLLGHTTLPLRNRFHQNLICSKAMTQIARGQKTLLIGALPRSGKTRMGAWIAKHFKFILIITTQPTETCGQWLSVFTNHREFSGYQIRRLDAESSAQIALSNTNREPLVAVVSTQFLKHGDRHELKGLDWDIVLLDEIHAGGSTELSAEMMNLYVGLKPIRVMMTATYIKPVDYYMIPADCCFFWDLEDARLMRSWGEPSILARLSEKYGALDVRQALDMTYASGETDTSIRVCYESSPRLGILTNVMQQDIYERFRTLADSPGNIYGFSMRSLFMLTKDGKAFQNQDLIDNFLASISGSDYLTRYGSHGNMSMFARIRRYWKTLHHRDHDSFMTQMWFLPYGQGQEIADLKPVIANRINANPVLKNYAIHTLDAGSKMDGIKIDNFTDAVAYAVIGAKEKGKKGLILLTGNVASLGVSLPEVDVAFMLHDIGSADMNFQQMMRVGTEMVSKKCGIIVDFNLWRVLTTLNAYATSRCGQANKSSADRINWCISHLIDVDPDMWDCPESP